jgi:hypothetical protein
VSRGGIVARYYLLRLGGTRHVDRYVSFVSAHHGTKAFPVAWYPALRDIKPQSRYMREAR